MRRFKNPELRVQIKSPVMFVGDEGLPVERISKWLCTSNVHAINIIERVMNQYDPFQRATVHIPLDKVIPKVLQLAG